MIVSTNWRLENTKSPAAMLQESNPQTTRMSIPRSVYLISFVAFAMYIYVRLEACDYTELLSLR